MTFNTAGISEKNPVTCKASDVLIHRTGYCYAKSHLLAALLRANNIPTGLCYQRLSVGTAGAPYCLHGLNAIYLTDFGWYKVDARGNKPGVSAQFTPPEEQLAFVIKESLEQDLPEIWSAPMPAIVETLEKYSTVTEVHENLPDIS
jgi:transglutaminase-like putative cysteine protease